ncbi:MAG: 30S ribosome-binding factor RbfA [Desulfobacterales bacterium]|nr:30S ribosome-binding factor RbfA [Desulfobacterales bacterium]MDD4071459.1 30S ribosome-binding factor RbfA [Desulfobacterales bacterium]MDD4393209.1 30S ribosome-binding factor RbfA [Desulfobacterales bacterium]
MTTFSRSDRVGVLIQQVLSDILRKGIQDPRLDLTTISAVKMSRDLRTAKIYFVTSGGDEKREAAEQAFQHALGFIKRSLASQLNLRYMPELKFFYDQSFDYGSHIDRLLKSVQRDDESNPTNSEK